MEFKVGVGKSDFEALRKSNDYYVDKTDIIYELVEETGNQVTLFTRPRRFGKTLMMSMLLNFFSISKDSRDVFQGLKITKHNEFCEKWMNQYPVLYISFKDVEADDFNDAYDMLVYRISEVCIELAYLINYAEIDTADKEVFAGLKSKSAKSNALKNSLKTIMRMMYTVYGKKVILLIDEYDVPLARASEKNTEENKYYSSMLGIIRGIMSTALKDNEFLEFAVVTGCLHIAKESIFTGTNNFASYSVLDEDFSEYFGFSEEEVNNMLSAADRQDRADSIREWADS